MLIEPFEAPKVYEKKVDGRVIKLFQVKSNLRYISRKGYVVVVVSKRKIWSMYGISASYIPSNILLEEQIELSQLLDDVYRCDLDEITGEYDKALSELISREMPYLEDYLDEWEIYPYLDCNPWFYYDPKLDVGWVEFLSSIVVEVISSSGSDALIKPSKAALKTIAEMYAPKVQNIDKRKKTFVFAGSYDIQDLIGVAMLLLYEVANIKGKREIEKVYPELIQCYKLCKL